MKKTKTQRAVLTLTDKKEGGFSMSLVLEPSVKGRGPITSPSVGAAIAAFKFIRDEVVKPTPPAAPL